MKSGIQVKILQVFGLVLGAMLVFPPAQHAEAQQLRVLVTNDDGIGATGTEGGIDVLVDELSLIHI